MARAGPEAALYEDTRLGRECTAIVLEARFKGRDQQNTSAPLAMHVMPSSLQTRELVEYISVSYIRMF